jgi:hypothetical protein
LVTTLEDVFAATRVNEKAVRNFVEEIVMFLPEAPDSYKSTQLVNAGQMTPPGDRIDVRGVGRNQCANSTPLA